MESAPTWAPAQRARDWRVVDRALRSIATRRAALDADEARWLREAEALQIWRRLGMVNALDYMERTLGYAPRAAQERLRVARALGSLPELEGALSRGELAFCAVRELTRVVTPQTEATWIRAATDKNLRQIEELVAGHGPGDKPEDPADPDIRTRIVRFELAPETYATLRQARAMLDDEHGKHLDDNELVAALAAAVIEGASTKPTGRAKFQIAVILCRRCQQGWQDGAGALIPIGPAAVARAECDAQRIGSIDGDTPSAATQDIPPKVRRFVMRRDHGRCRVPGCRSARNVDPHHLTPRADGGSHTPPNLICVCGSCHVANHEGRLLISGTADRLQVVRIAESRRLPLPETETPARFDEPSAHVGAAHAMGTRAQATDALTRMGFKQHVARDAITAALAEVGEDLPLEQLVFQSLRRCPRPKA